MIDISIYIENLESLKEYMNDYIDSKAIFITMKMDWDYGFDKNTKPISFGMLTFKAWQNRYKIFANQEKYN